jgi:osmotically inducible protein OsmC
MVKRSGNAVWEGNLKEGTGRLNIESVAFGGSYSAASRFEDGSGTNPEELLAAAHAACYSMALAHELSQAGHKPEQVSTTAHAALVKEGEGFAIKTMELETEVKVSGLDDAEFQEKAEGAKKNCPVSKALQGLEIKLNAKLL